MDDVGVYHDERHNHLQDAVEAIETELGTDPRGPAESVKARVTAGAQAFRQLHWPSGGYVSNKMNNTANTTFSVSSNILRYQPIWVPASGVVDQVSAEVTTGGAGNARYAFYDVASDGRPGALVADVGEVDTTAAAVKSLTTSQSVVGEKVYYMALLAGIGASWRAAGVGAQWLLGDALVGSSPYNQWSSARTYALGFPSVATDISVSMVNGAPVLFTLRRT
jgi:hypothetical protein